NGIDPMHLTFFRVATTALLAGAVLLIRNRAAFKISLKQIRDFAILGVFGVAFLQFCYVMALTRLTVGLTLLIEYLAIIAVALIAFFFFKEQVKNRIWLAIGLVIIGLLLVAQIGNSDLDIGGVLLALGAAASLTIFFLVGEKQIQKT